MTDPRYDALAYADYVHRDADVAHLATVASLLGHPVAPLRGARVLDIGCAQGQHLLALAELYPELEALGIDPSERQIDEARRRAERLGLKNLRFEAWPAERLLEAQEGAFDFVVCQGVYSWVSASVRQTLVEVLGRALARDGVAFLGFNTQPGWALGQVLRHALAQYVDPGAAPARQIATARAALGLLGQSLERTTPARAALGAELDRALGADPAYLFHEYLSPENHAFYRADVVATLRAAGLNYCCDADLSGLDDRSLLDTLDVIAMRRYHSAVVVRAHHPVGAIDPERLVAMHWVTPLALTQDITPGLVRSDSRLTFEHPNGQRITLSDVATKALVGTLAAHRHRPLPAVDALSRAARLADLDTPTLWRQLAPAALVTRGWLRPSVEAPRWVDAVSEHPRASALARDDAATGRDVTTRDLRQLTLTPFERAVLCQLDGTRDLAALWRDLAPQALEGSCGDALNTFAQNALLIG